MTGFQPQKCNTTLQDDTYRVIVEKKVQLSSEAGADGVEIIINAFPTDLIDDHSLCVEFSDIYNVLYVTVDSAPIYFEFYETFLTIEQEVTNEIEAVILVRLECLNLKMTNGRLRNSSILELSITINLAGPRFLFSLLRRSSLILK